jgi:hypothetical protein
VVIRIVEGSSFGRGKGGVNVTEAEVVAGARRRHGRRIYCLSGFCDSRVGNLHPVDCLKEKKK